MSGCGWTPVSTTATTMPAEPVVRSQAAGALMPATGSYRPHWLPNSGSLGTAAWRKRRSTGSAYWTAASSCSREANAASVAPSCARSSRSSQTPPICRSAVTPTPSAAANRTDSVGQSTAPSLSRTSSRSPPGLPALRAIFSCSGRAAGTSAHSTPRSSRSERSIASTSARSRGCGNASSTAPVRVAPATSSGDPVSASSRAFTGSGICPAAAAYGCSRTRTDETVSARAPAA